MGGNPGQRNKSLHSVYANERTDERFSPRPETKNPAITAAARVIPAFISRRIANWDDLRAVFCSFPIFLLHSAAALAHLAMQPYETNPLFTPLPYCGMGCRCSLHTQNADLIAGCSSFHYFKVLRITLWESICSTEDSFLSLVSPLPCNKPCLDGSLSKTLNCKNLH